MATSMATPTISNTAATSLSVDATQSAEPNPPIDEASICQDCGSEQSNVKLECSKHVVCASCVGQRAISKPQNLLKCEECVKRKESASEDTPGGIWIFLDNSNIWIEAKKLQSKKRKFKTKEDNRLRIEVGNLADAVAGGRTTRKGMLFGSEPPPLDSVWKKVREIKNFEVHTKQRSQITGKEKQVDTQLAVKITGIAIKTPLCERTTIILITGDADMIPALDEVLHEEKWTVEIYMWNHATSGDLRRFAEHHNKRVKIQKLDNYMDDVTSIKRKLNHIPEDQSLLQKVKESSVVFTMKQEAFPNRIPTDDWCIKLENITHWPFQYYWLEEQTTDNLLIVFQHNEKEKPDITKFIKIIRDAADDSSVNYCLPDILKIETYLTFEGYEVVKRKHAKKKRPSDPCPYKKNCHDGTKCSKVHSDAEKEYFRKRINGQGNTSRKTIMCKSFKDGKCRKAANDCEFAHGDSDAWCTRCHLHGHFKNDCPKENS